MNGMIDIFKKYYLLALFISLIIGVITSIMCDVNV